MTRTLRFSLLLILLSGAISVWWGHTLGTKVSGGPVDFQAVYYGSRTLIQHHNPYSVSQLDAELVAERGPHPTDTLRGRRCITLYVNLPPTLLFVAPFALLPLATAQSLWMALSAILFTTAAFLIWEVAAQSASALSTCLVVFLLANCQFVFGTGNTAGIVVPLCIIAACCFLQERFIPVGVFFMAVSLLIKPHDAGLIWLYFLLAGAVSRKRALQSAALAAILAVPAVLWVAYVVPNWIHDWRANMALISAPGGLNDPSPTLELVNSAQSIISLQGVFAVFRDNPAFYNPAAYLVCGILVLVWTITTLRSATAGRNLATPQLRAWLALAAIAPLTVLVTYHRIYDAKLLLLTIPACAILWARRGILGWLAVVVNSIAFFFNGDVPITILNQAIINLHLSIATLPGKFVTVLLARSNQESLLLLSVFYVWNYVRHSRAEAAHASKSALPTAVQHLPA